MSRVGFVDPAELGFAPGLLAATSAITTELSGLLGLADLRGWVPYPETEYYTGMWEVFGLIAGDQLNRGALARCPRTAALLAGVPELRQAHFSALHPGARILPHRGAPGVLRVALVLVVQPGAAGWEVDGVKRQARVGELVVFDDGSQHAAWNDGELARITLLFDSPDPALSPEARSRLLAEYDAQVAGGLAARKPR